MTDVPPPPPPASGYGATGQPALPNPLVSYWKKVVLENYANFEGRARRSEYWWFTLANVVVFVALFILGAISNVFLILLFVYWLALLVPSIAVAVRRLHDTDKAWYFILLGFVPFVGGIILLVLMVLDSTSGANQWGVSEKYP
jgi:uncharacterized membrane protein YhaH (DUF805 family)